MDRCLSHIFYIIITLGIIINFSACSKPEKANEYTIGFSQCTMDDAWREQMLNEMEREVLFVKDAELTILAKDAKSDIEKQKNDIRELINNGVDVLIVSPLKSEPLKHIIDSVAALNIPVILIDRHINCDEEVYYIGSNNFKIGAAAAEEAIRLLPNGGDIYCFNGLKGSKPALERMNGFNSVMKKHSQYRLNNINCDWTEQTAYNKIQEVLREEKPFDLIFAHNDFMARGVIKALQESSQEIPPIIGVDGLNAPNLGIDLVVDSLLSTTFTYPTGGDVAIRTAFSILNHEKVQQNQELISILINLDNVKAIKIQQNAIDNQANRIDQQNLLISDSADQISYQRRKTKGITSILLSLIIVLTTTFYIIRKRTQNQAKDTNADIFKYSFPTPYLSAAKDDEKLFIAEIEKVVLENLINEKVTIEFLASRFGMSHSTIYRKIKLITGLKGIELINLIRMQYAEKLISTTNLSIKEIAFQTGFSTSSYFSTSFLKQFGVSPVKFRKLK